MDLERVSTMNLPFNAWPTNNVISELNRQYTLEQIVKNINFVNNNFSFIADFLNHHGLNDKIDGSAKSVLGTNEVKFDGSTTGVIDSFLTLFRKNVIEYFFVIKKELDTVYGNYLNQKTNQLFKTKSEVFEFDYKHGWNPLITKKFLKNLDQLCKIYDSLLETYAPSSIMAIILASGTGNKNVIIKYSVGYLLEQSLDQLKECIDILRSVKLYRRRRFLRGFEHVMLPISPVV